jgi:hypothetical protein
MKHHAPMRQLRRESASAVRSNIARLFRGLSRCPRYTIERPKEEKDRGYIDLGSHQLTALSETRPLSPQSPSMLVSSVIAEFQDRVKAMSSTWRPETHSPMRGPASQRRVFWVSGAVINRHTILTVQ